MRPQVQSQNLQQKQNLGLEEDLITCIVTLLDTSDNLLNL